MYGLEPGDRFEIKRIAGMFLKNMFVFFFEMIL